MRVYVYKSAYFADEQLAELIAILEAAGFDVVVIEACADQEIAPDVVFTADDVLVVVMVSDCDADVQLMALSERVSRAGGRVIGVWPKDGVEGPIASPLEWHGASVVPWSAPRIADVVVGEDTWETPSGQKRLAPHTDRHKC